jgi:hypothetical protein
MFALHPVGDRFSPSVRESATVEILGEALRRKEQVIAAHRGRPIAFCPHALAAGPRGFLVLAFVILGDDVPADYSSAQRWRWLSVGDLQGCSRRGGGVWFSAPPETRPPLDPRVAAVEVAC